MWRTVLRAVTPILVLVTVTACGGNNPAAPESTLTITGAPPTFPLGSSQQLQVSAPCPNIQWTSSAPAILSISPDGVATAQSPGDADITATCGSASAMIHARVSSARGVNICCGLVTPVRVGGTLRLTSSALSGTPQHWIDCVASSWTSSRADVATVVQTGAAAMLTARAPGQTTITATCDGITASVTVQVTAGWTVAIWINEVAPISMAITDATVEVLSGAHAGTRVRSGPAGLARLIDMEFPFRVRLSADEYQETEFDVTSDNVTNLEHSSAYIDLRMKPLPPPPDTDEFVVTLGPQEQRIWNVPVRRPGTLSAVVRFELDYNDDLLLELRCNDALLASGRMRGGRSPALTAAVPGPCAGEVKVRPQIRYPSVSLRLRVSYPH